MLTCRHTVEKLTDAWEGKLSPFRRAMRSIHLWFCPGCKRYEQQMEATVKTLGRLPSEPPPTALKEDLLEHFRRKCK